MLFVIVMEALSRMKDRAIEGGFFTGFSMGGLDGNSILVSNLLFAYDTLIFYDVVPSQLLHLRFVINWFEATSSLRINLGKSKLVPIGNVSSIGDLANILGCKTASLPMKYLGLPLGTKYKAKAIWNPIVENWKDVWWVEK